jgi:hypothetical protein
VCAINGAAVFSTTLYLDQILLILPEERVAPAEAAAAPDHRKKRGRVRGQNGNARREKKTGERNALPRGWS